MQVREAILAEAALIYQLIQAKAEFDRSIGAYSGTVQTTVEKIEKTIFGDRPFAFVLLVEERETVIGFALYGFRYSSFVGHPSIWLDDLFVHSKMRNCGAGTLLMDRLRQIAQDNNCSHLAWTADARNIKELKFYDRLGAKIGKQKGDRCFFYWKIS
ncbi:MAG: GNAT family N-acetyltransferase [Cyanobacteria bacterium P01_C01_bin.72]